MTSKLLYNCLTTNYPPPYTYKHTHTLLAKAYLIIIIIIIEERGKEVVVERTDV